MKLVCLNAWGGRMGAAFIDFVRTHKDADIFCFQEIFSNGESGNFKALTGIQDANPNIYQELNAVLNEHWGIFCPVVPDNVYGIATYIKKDIVILDQGEVYLYRNDNFPGPKDADASKIEHTRKMQWVRIENDGAQTVIMNLHGYHSKEKTDIPERIEQSRIIVEFIKTLNVPFVLAGDFNMTLDTESTRMIEACSRNLVREYKVTTTRNELYKKPEKYADYIFTSGDIAVKHFDVLPNVVSDHCPLIVEW
jgi:endonuclease/exonuclease/phosphatase family metal-dependent hydrolase